MLTSPVFVSLPAPVLSVNPKVDHDPVVGGKIDFPISDQLISVHFQSVPPLAGGHTPLAPDASLRINQFSVLPRLSVSNADIPQRCIKRSNGQNLKKASPADRLSRPVGRFSMPFSPSHVISQVAPAFDGR